MSAWPLETLAGVKYGSVSALDKIVAGHLLGLGYAHDMEDGGSDIGEDTVLDLGIFVFGDIDAGHGVEGMGGVGSAVAFSALSALPWSAMIITS